MDSWNLGGIRLLDRKSRNILELDTLGSEPRKSETKAWLSEFLPRLPELWGNKTDLKRTDSSSIDWFKNQICLTLFLFKVSPSKRLFKPLLGLVWRGPSRLYKMLVPACVATKCNAHAWQRWSGKIAASKGVPTSSATLTAEEMLQRSSARDFRSEVFR